MSLDDYTDKEARGVLATSDKLVVLYFWHDTCSPCKSFSPVLKEIAEELADDIDVVKINAEDNEILLNFYNVRSFPTIITFRYGIILDVKLSVSTKSDFITFLKGSL